MGVRWATITAIALAGAALSGCTREAQDSGGAHVDVLGRSDAESSDAATAKTLSGKPH